MTNRNENKGKAFGSIVTEGYDYSVASRMIGRSGAYTPTGGKGIAFEVMYCDKKNLENLFKPDHPVTQFTKSPVAETVDLVTMTGNKVDEFIQCKDVLSNSGINKVLCQAKNGKYRNAKLVGTSETAKFYNQKAAENGISKKMIDSGISSADTNRIARKFNGIAGTEGVASIMSSSAQIGGVFSGGIAAVESFVNGDDVGDAARNISSAAVQGAVSSAAGAAAAEAVAGALAATALASVMPFGLAVSTIAAIGAGTVVGEVAAIPAEIVGEVAGATCEVAETVIEGVGDIISDISDCVFCGLFSLF